MQRAIASIIFVGLGLASGTVGADEVLSSTSKVTGSAGYEVVFDDPRDQLIQYQLLPASAYFGRGIALGLNAAVRVRMLPWLRLEASGQVPYVTFIKDPKVIIAEGLFHFGGTTRDDSPQNVELTRSAEFRRVDSTSGITTTKTQSLQGVRGLTSLSWDRLRVGARLYVGSTDPAAPTNRGAADKRVDSTLLYAVLGWESGFAANWKVRVDQFGDRSDRTWIATGADLMYAPIRDYSETVADARDDFLFPLGARMHVNMGGFAPFGVALKSEFGLNGAGAGWYAMLALGVGGGFIPVGE